MSLINVRLPSWNTDIVAIIDPATSNQVFKDARPAEVKVTDESVLMEHPREDGSVQVDHAVIQPIIIEMKVILGGREARSIFGDLQNYKDEGIQLSVNLKAGTYDQMFLEAVNHEEKPEMFDSFPIALRFREALLTNAGNDSITVDTAEAADDATTIQKGIQGAETIFGALADAGDAALAAYQNVAEFTE